MIANQAMGPQPTCAQPRWRDDEQGADVLKLVLLPGLGADERMFDGLRAGGFDVCDQPILMPEWGESLRVFAHRLAGHIAGANNGAFVLGGASFGGMLASEMCSVLQPAALLQLGSCLTGEALGPLIRKGGELIETVPAIFLKAPPCRLLAIRYHLGPVSRDVYSVTRDMFNKTPTELIRRGVPMILNWPGPERISCPVYRVHGAKDRLLRLVDCPAVIDGAFKTLVVEDAGHLVSMTHEGEVNRFVADMLAELNG